jgi:hypothetical protein
MLSLFSAFIVLTMTLASPLPYCPAARMCRSHQSKRQSPGFPKMRAFWVVVEDESAIPRQKNAVARWISLTE